jgi:phosphoglycerol transferase MdoB-like AlkP superfamily enzyme
MLKPLVFIIRLVLPLLLIFFIARLGFSFFVAAPQAAGQGIKEWLQAYWWGLRSDAAVVFLINLIPIIFLLFFKITKKYHVAKWMVLVLLLVNTPFLFVEFADIIYYPFNHHRSTKEILTLIGGSKHMIGNMLLQYWWALILFLALIYFLYVYWHKLLRSKYYELKANWWHYGTSYLLLALVLFFNSTHYNFRLISPYTPYIYVAPSLQPVATNSSFCFIHSYVARKEQFASINFFEENAVNQLDNLQWQKSSDANGYKIKNVVVFIVESYSKEYVQTATKAYTPFMDSLQQQSIVCQNAYANGLVSNRGVSAILSGIPQLMVEPSYYSFYANNKYEALPKLLAQQGYQTFFAMGAEKDHFGFEKLTRQVGINNYINGDDYGNGKHHDGVWGISDHYFLPFIAKQLKQKGNKPFYASIFNLSTHYPVTIPKEVAALVNKNDNHFKNGMTYYDYSVKLFFEEIKNEPWFNETVFVFCADHSLAALWQPNYNAFNQFQIPLFFYSPQFVKQPVYVQKPVQQIDINATILDLLNYQKPIFSFGKSVLDAAPSITLNKYEGSIQITDSAYVLGYNLASEQFNYLYHHPTDSLCQYNLINKVNNAAIENLKNKLKARWQQYCNRMIENKLYLNN